MAHDEHNQKPHEEWHGADHSNVSDDPWHDHSGDEKPQHAHGETTPAGIAAVGLISFGLLVLSIVGVWIFFDQMLRLEYDRKQDMFTGEPALELRARWEAELNEYGWADPATNRVVIPIDRAVDLVAAEYAKKAQ